MARARRVDDDDFDDRPRRPRRRDEDDEDDDDFDDRRPARRLPPSVAPKVLLIIGGVVVLLALICGGVALYIYTSVARGVGQAQQQMQQDLQKNMEAMQKDMAKRQEAEANSDKAKATAAVTAFLQEVRGDRAAAAYRLTSADYRLRVSESEFGGLVAADAAALRSGAAMVFPDVFAPDAGTTYAFEVPAGFATVRVTAVKEGGKWAIDRFAVANR